MSMATRAPDGAAETGAKADGAAVGVAPTTAQAVIAGKTIYLRGQAAQDLETRECVSVGDPAGQAHKTVDNIELLLGECGAKLEHIVTATVYLTDMAGYQAHGKEIGAVWRRLAGTEYPAMAAVGVTRLWLPELLVEIQGIAVING